MGDFYFLCGFPPAFELSAGNMRSLNNEKTTRQVILEKRRRNAVARGGVWLSGAEGGLRVRRPGSGSFPVTQTRVLAAKKCLQTLPHPCTGSLCPGSPSWLSQVSWDTLRGTRATRDYQVPSPLPEPHSQAFHLPGGLPTAALSRNLSPSSPRPTGGHPR